VTVEEDENCAADWTFETLKNCYNLPGAKALFTYNKGSTNEIATTNIVPSTAVSQISHALLQMREKRKVFSPAVLYTDTCPHNEKIWKGMFGQYLQLKLGLFHLLHRIMDTLDPRSWLYWDCVVKLRNAMYRYNFDNEASLIIALKDGTFSKTGEKLTDDDIRRLRHSKKWNERCMSFLCKINYLTWANAKTPAV
jgi:hypothetical protein